MSHLDHEADMQDRFYIDAIGGGGYEIEPEDGELRCTEPKCGIYWGSKMQTDDGETYTAKHPHCPRCGGDGDIESVHDVIQVV